MTDDESRTDDTGESSDIERTESSGTERTHRPTSNESDVPTSNESDVPTSIRQLRVRKRLDESFSLVIVALVVLALFGGWVAYQTHVSPAVETEHEPVSTWDEHTTASHYAQVTEPNPVFAENTTLTNEQLYFTQVTPEFTSEYEYDYRASHEGELNVELQARLQLQAVDDDGNAYWRHTETIDRIQHENVSPDESVSISADLNVSDVMTQVDEIEASLGASVGTTEVGIVFLTHATGTVNDESISNRYQETLLIEPGSQTYSIESVDGVDEEYETTQQVESPVTYGLLRSYGSVVLLLLSLLGLGTLLVLRARNHLTVPSQAVTALEQYQQRKEFDEWISTGRIPNDALTGPEIELDSLEDLVDVAIDTNNRVIADKERDAFVVTDADRYYTFSERQRDHSDSPLAVNDSALVHESISATESGNGHASESSTEGGYIQLSEDETTDTTVRE